MQSSVVITVPDRWQRPFFTIWIGQAFSMLGSSLAPALLHGLPQSIETDVMLYF